MPELLEEIKQEDNFLVAPCRVELCCKEMAEEIFLHPYENYSYLWDRKIRENKRMIIKIKTLLKKEKEQWIHLDECPFCGWKPII